MDINFKIVIDNMADGVVIANTASRRFSYANKRLCELSGYSREEILKMGIDDFHPKKDLPYVLEQFKNQCLKRLSLAKNIPVLKKDGSVIMCDVNAVPLDENEIVGIFRDSTDRNKAEALLKNSEAKYRQLVEKLQEDYFFYRHDTKGVFEYVSPSIHDMLGYHAEEFLQHYTKHLTLNPVNNEAGLHTEMSIKGIKQPAYEVEIYHKNGTTRWLEVSELPVFADNEKVIAVEGIAHDITEQKIAQENLMRSEQEWQRTFDSISDMVFIIATDNTIKKANKGLLLALGMREEDVVGKKCFEVIHKSDKPWPLCPHAKTVADGTAHMEEVDDPALGIPLLVSTSPIFDEHGICTGSVHIAKDITEIRNTKKALEEKIDELERFQRVTMGREKRVIELKEEIARLKLQLERR